MISLELCEAVKTLKNTEVLLHIEQYLIQTSSTPYTHTHTPKNDIIVYRT